LWAGWSPANEALKRGLKAHINLRFHSFCA
jgi:hypothetical protein